MKISDFFKKVVVSIVVFFSAIVTFVFYRNRRQRLDQNKQLCSAVGEGITSSAESIKNVSDRIGDLSEQSQSVADIIREYNERELKTKGNE